MERRASGTGATEEEQSGQESSSTTAVADVATVGVDVVTTVEARDDLELLVVEFSGLGD